MFAKTTFAALLITAGLAAGAQQANAGERHFSIGVSPSGLTVNAGHRGHGYPSWRRGWTRNHQLSGREVRRELRRAGFVRVFDLDRRGPVYVALARARNGHLYRLRVSAFDGDVLSSRIVYGRRGRH